MRAVFLIAIFDSFGEREHALRCSLQLAAAGIETVFVVTAPAAAYLEARGVRPRTFATPDEARAILDELAPDWLIACEYYNLPAPLQALVAASPARRATMDGTGMGPEINSNPLGLPSAPPPIELPAGMIRLRPCPVNAPLATGDGAYAWPLFPDVARTDGSAARRRWGVSRGTRIAMIALAPWALAAAARLGRAAHYRALLGAIVEGLALSGERVDLFVISPDEPPAVSRGPVHMRFVRYLAADVYEELLLGADLVISDNVIQTSICKAYCARVPALVLVDSSPEAPPWNMFPLRLRFPTDSPWVRAIAPVELGRPADVRARIASALAGQVPDDGGYRQALAALPSASEILAAAALLS